MSSEEPDLPVAAEDNETVIICTKCGKEFNMAFDTDLDLEEDSDLYKELLTEHEFICSSDFPDFEVKEKSHRKYIEKSDAEEAIDEARQQERQKILDKLEFQEYFVFENRSEEFNHGFRKALEELRDELEEEVEQS